MKFVSDKLKYYWTQIKDFCVYKVLHADDPPHRLALGIAIGMFVTLLPLIGIQMMLTVFLAWMFRANKLVGIPLVWISNPLTIIPIYFPSYWLGCKLMGIPVVTSKWVDLKQQWEVVDADPTSTWGVRVKFWWDSLLEFVWPLSLGSLIVASVFGVISYYISLYLIRSYRMKRWGQLMPPNLTPTDINSIEQGEESRPSDNHRSGESAA